MTYASSRNMYNSYFKLDKVGGGDRVILFPCPVNKIVLKIHLK